MGDTGQTSSSKVDSPGTCISRQACLLDTGLAILTLPDLRRGRERLNTMGFAGFRPSVRPPLYVITEVTGASRSGPGTVNEWRLFDNYFTTHTQRGNETESIFLAPYALVTRVLYHTSGLGNNRTGTITITVGQWDHTIGGPIPQVLACFDRVSLLLGDRVPSASPAQATEGALVSIQADRAPETEHIQCGSCGALLEGNGRFCGRCGSEVKG